MKSADDARLILAQLGAQAYLGSLPIPAWMLTPKGRVWWTNDGGLSLLGRDAEGRHFSHFIAPEHVNDERELFARKVVGREDPAIHETVLLVGGVRRRAELVSVPIYDDGSLGGVVVLVRSTTKEEGGATADRRPLPRLTPRQHQVLALLAGGKSTRQIAAELGIAEETTRNHIRLLLNELRVHTRLEAVVEAFRNGWL